jgi:hypothetical protein
MKILLNRVRLTVAVIALGDEAVLRVTHGARQFPVLGLGRRSLLIDVAVAGAAELTRRCLGVVRHPERLIGVGVTATAVACSHLAGVRLMTLGALGNSAVPFRMAEVAGKLGMSARFLVELIADGAVARQAFRL